MYAGTKHKSKPDTAFLSQILTKEPIRWCEAEGRAEADLWESLCVQRLLLGIDSEVGAGVTGSSRVAKSVSIWETLALGASGW